MKIPVIVNGGISTFADVEHALAHTGCDGVMSSESILEYPALFDPSQIYDMDDLTLEYVDFYEKYRGEANLKILKAHLHKFMHSGFNIHGNADLRERLNKIGFKDEKLDEVRDLVNEMKTRRKGVAPIDKITWYYRHWKDSGQLALEGVKNKDQMPKSYIDDAEWDSWMLDDPRNPQSQKAKDKREAEKQRLKEQKKQEKAALK